MKNVLAACCLIILSAMPVPALATETARLEPVVVTAGRIEEPAKNVTASMTVIPREEIEKNQYEDMGGLLRNHGIQVNSYSGNSSLSQIAIRGVRTSLMGTHGLDGAILLLVDGRRTGTDNIAMIPLVNVERIEIIRGPGAVQYGSSAIGGVVNVITRRGTENLKAMAEAGLGSWDTYRAQGDMAWARGPFDFSGGVSYVTANDYRYASGHRYANTDLNYKIGYSLNAGYTFLDEHRIGVTMIGVRADEMGSPGYYNNLTNEYTDRDTYSFDLGYEGGYAPSGLSWKGRYFNGKNNYLSDARDESWRDNPYAYDPYFKSGTTFQGAQGQVSFSKSIVTLTGGVDWNKYDTRFWGASYSPHEHSEYDNLGVFLLARLGLFDDRLMLFGGARYDEYSLEVQDQDRDLYKTTPSFGAAWHATDWLTLKGNYGESYRIPQAVELVGFKGMYSYTGNPDLKPEKGKTIDAGFEINHKSLNLGLTYFRTDYKRKIVYGGWVDGGSMYVNLDGKTKYRGLELAAGYDIGQALDWDFTLRPYVNMTRMLKYRDNTGAKVQYVSDMNIAWGLNFQHPGWGTDVDLRFTRIGKQDVTDWNDKSSAYGQNVEIGGQITADLFVSQTVKQWDDWGKLSLTAEALNLGNARYETVKDYPAPGRSFYLGLRYDY